MNYFWIIVRCIEDLAAYLLLFTLLTACVVRWRRKKLAVTFLAIFILCVVGASVLALALGHKLFTAGPHFMTLRNMFVVAVVIHLIGYVSIARFGWRRRDPDALPAAATWPRSRLLLAFLVALVLNVVTHWNITLAVHQRLAHEVAEARVVAMSVLPGRPIDSLNAAMIYEPVFERIPKPYQKFVPDECLEFDKPLDTNNPALRELLANHRRDLDAVVRASIQPQCYFGIQPRDFIGSLSWLGPMHAAGKLLAVDTRVRIADGDLAGATRNTSAMFRVARHMDQTPTLVTALVGAAIDRSAIDCLQALLNHPDLSAEMLSGLKPETRADYRRILRRVSVLEEAALTTYVKRISAEGFQFLDAINEEDFSSPSQIGAIGTFLWKEANPYFIEHELEVFRSAYRQHRALLDHPWPEASVQNAKFLAVRQRGVLAAVLMPGLESAVVHVLLGDARHHLCRLAIAMRLYELEHGELPESFDALTPKYIDELPMDPSIEKPFKMENIEGGVRLYSAGIEAWDREKYPGDRIKDSDATVEMFLK